MSWTKRPDFEGFEALYCFHENSLISSTVVMIVRQTTGEELAVVLCSRCHAAEITSVRQRSLARLCPVCPRKETLKSPQAVSSGSSVFHAVWAVLLLKHNPARETLSLHCMRLAPINNAASWLFVYARGLCHFIVFSWTLLTAYLWRVTEHKHPRMQMLSHWSWLMRLEKTRLDIFQSFISIHHLCICSEITRYLEFVANYNTKVSCTI